MTYTPNVTRIQQVNSTTYSDKLGLLIGLDRLQGETSLEYVKRLEAAVRLRREHPYEGALNEVTLQLGFKPSVYLEMELGPSQVVQVSIAGIKIGDQSVPILIFEKDTMWKWRMLSEVVTDLNKIVSTSLLVKDGPAFQLSRQTNSLWSIAEPIVGIRTQLAHSGIQVSSVVFNTSVPSYTLSTSGLLVFDLEPDSGTEITYNYIVAPYRVVGSPLAMIGLKDPEIQQVAATSDSALSYQLREFIQSIMQEDRSYWAK